MLDMSDRDDAPLGYLLHRLASALRADVTASVLEPLDLTFPQYVCMRILSRRPGQSNAELARDVMVSPQAMNIVVRGLQDRGLVSRPATVAAGRSLPAELTREGRALLGRTNEGIRGAEQRVLGGLSERDRRELRRILSELD
ncbi:MarR family transcriptional regulator [Mycolicibacterium rufum]|uniref:MarR family transcriptional regulator n=1 Tax=Mycolicibacterium rufum TaxID=318424 RepID=A0A9X2YC12_9MYCO|nr:MarR family transcriptional regulator [Mycolicibacterium rufum]MCV7070393.1 MarR family transcriptional regulator [Mycolicibacterium rufum]ULP38718.1 MarR family transcriptional regulator [Mycolicibacterium rufum]